MWETREPLRGRLSTVDLLVLTSLDKLVLILQKLCTFYKTGYINVPLQQVVTDNIPQRALKV
jgi:hypothetical protein